MAENTKISWADHTINFWWGCTKISPACAHCYAERQDAHFHPGIPWQERYQNEKATASHWGTGARFIRTPKAVQEAYRYQRRAIQEGRRFRVFTNSMSDFFEERSGLDTPRLIAFDTMRQTPNLDWLILTKRPENILDHIGRSIEAVMDKGGPLADWLQDWFDGVPPENVWLGTTVEDQEWADQRVPWLVTAPAAHRFLSCEPLLGPVDLTGLWGYPGSADEKTLDQWPIHEVVAGGESGPQARPSHPDWFRSLRDQCSLAHVPFHFKAWGEWGPCEDRCYVSDDDRCQIIGFNGLMGRPWLGWAKDHPERSVMFRGGKKATGRLLDGVEHNGLMGGSL